MDVERRLPFRAANDVIVVRRDVDLRRQQFTVGMRVPVALATQHDGAVGGAVVGERQTVGGVDLDGGFRIGGGFVGVEIKARYPQRVALDTEVEAVLPVVDERGVDIEIGHIQMWKIILYRTHIHTSSAFVQVLDIVDRMHSGQTVTGKPLSSVYLRFALMVKVAVGHIGNPTGNKVAAVGGSLRLLQKPMQVLGRRVLRYQGGIVAAFVARSGQRRETAFGNKLFKCNEIG